MMDVWWVEGGDMLLSYPVQSHSAEASNINYVHKKQKILNFRSQIFFFSTRLQNISDVAVEQNKQWGGKEDIYNTLYAL
jgi:hypothetical protein